MPSHPDKELCQRIVAESQDAIIFADHDGIIRLWNSGAEAMFGYPAEEAIGQTLDVIIPERLRQRHWDGWRKVMATGVTRYGREVLAVPAMRKDGARISIEFTIIVLRDKRGNPLGAAATIRDVTMRWQQEKDQKQRLADLEVRLKRLGQEVALHRRSQPLPQLSTPLKFASLFLKISSSSFLDFIFQYNISNRNRLYRVKESPLKYNLCLPQIRHSSYLLLKEL